MMIKVMFSIGLFLYSICYIPQIHKIYRHKKVGGISPWFHGLEMSASLCMWVVSLLSQQYLFVISFSLNFVMAGTILVGYAIYHDKIKKGKESSSKRYLKNSV